MKNARAIPLQDWTDPEASRRLRLQDSWHMKVVRLSALLTGHLYPPGNRMLEQLNPIPSKLFMECRGWWGNGNTVGIIVLVQCRRGLFQRR